MDGLALCTGHEVPMTQIPGLGAEEPRGVSPHRRHHQTTTLVDAVAPLDLTLTDDETKALGRAGHHAGTHLVLRSIVGTAC
jgi:hypothetical protein